MTMAIGVIGLRRDVSNHRGEEAEAKIGVEAGGRLAAGGGGGPGGPGAPHDLEDHQDRHRGERDHEQEVHRPSSVASRPSTRYYALDDTLPPARDRRALAGLDPPAAH